MRESGSGWGQTTVLGMLVGAAAASGAMVVGQSASPGAVHAAGLTIDRLSAVLSLLVAAIGAVTFRYSMRYLSGNPRQVAFLRTLACTVGAAYVFMLASNLLLLFAAWFLTSVGLHKLLTFYGDRPEAFRPARKKFLISRLGDLALIAAIVLIYRGWGTFDLGTFMESALGDDHARSVNMIGLLIAVAAMTKSAQFPFHSWLPETMEAPTPVSALMHAGIINAGGALLLKFAPLIARSPGVLLMLTVVGTLTFALGMLAMWAQVKVKRTLAWSTVSQMGFMMVQCGLGAFPVMALHIVGHGCYKAWSFLRSGELSTTSKAAVSPRRALCLAILGTLAAIPALAAATWLTGFSPLHSPGELALSAILAISIGQIWVAMLGAPTAKRWGGRTRIPATIAMSLSTAIAAFAIYGAAGAFLSPVFGPLPVSDGPAAWLAAVVPVVALAVFTAIHAALPSMNATPRGRAFHVHALHGFYFGAVADRFVDSVWNQPVHIQSGANNA